MSFETKSSKSVTTKFWCLAIARDTFVQRFQRIYNSKFNIQDNTCILRRWKSCRVRERLRHDLDIEAERDIMCMMHLLSKVAAAEFAQYSSVLFCILACLC